MDNSDDQNSREKPAHHRRPANTAFKQQRLRAWQPILTPWTVLPVFFLLGITMIPLGAWFYTVALGVPEVLVDYSKCSESAPVTLQNVDQGGPLKQWSFQNGVCTLRFQVEQPIPAPVFLYYRLTNFYQNHRRYVKSVSANQLIGTKQQQGTGQATGSECDPLFQPAGSTLTYYPCGLIANSMFNDTIGEVDSTWTQFSMAAVPSSTPFTFTSKGITWESDAAKYGPTKLDRNSILPPKDWGVYRGVRLSGNDSWANQAIMFDPSQDEQFQVWMRTAGLPTFRKLYAQNMQESLPAGLYELKIIDRYPVNSYSGTKSIVVSTTSWLGGKNTFLGVAYLVVGSICLALGLVFLIKQKTSPRKLGDHTYLSWNQVQQPARSTGASGASPDSPQ